MQMKARTAVNLTFVSLTCVSLAACASIFGTEEVQVRPITNTAGLESAPRDRYYESAVTAIGERDYGRALDYLQESRSRDQNSVKTLNALGVVYDKLGRFDLSARYYAQAQALEPNSRIVAKNLAYSKILQGIRDPGDLPNVAVNVSPPATSTQANEQVAAAISPTSRAVTFQNNAPKKEQPLISGSPSVVRQEMAVLPPPTLKSSLRNLPRPLAPVLKSTKVLTIGRPVNIINASGQAGRSEIVSRRLKTLGWTVRLFDVPHVEKSTVLLFPSKYTVAAKALKNTLPFPVRMVSSPNGVAGIRLVVGRDYLSWKSGALRLAGLRQKPMFAAHLQKASLLEVP